MSYDNPVTHYMGPYASVRQMLNELEGVRLSATSNSLWAISDTLDTYAYLALIDAFAQYPVVVEDMYFTASSVSSSNYGIVVLPRDVHNINEMWHLTDNHRVVHYEHVPTQQTNYVKISAVTNSTLLRLHYTQQINWVPRNMTMGHDYYGTTGGIDGVNVQGDVIKGGQVSWPYRGYGAISFSNYQFEEVFRYDQFENTWNDLSARVPTLRNLTREVYGHMDEQTLGWQSVVNAGGKPIVSYAVVAPRSTLLPVMIQAQANMFQYWLSDRASYEKYTAIASRQMYSQEELLTLIHSLEARAQLRYSQAHRRNMPRPASVRLRVPLPK